MHSSKKAHFNEPGEFNRREGKAPSTESKILGMSVLWREGGRPKKES